MDRKKFIITSSLTAIGMSTYGSIIKMPSGCYTGDCETTNDILGPYYRPNAPMRSDLTHKDLRGARIQLNGTVYQGDCNTPLKGAMVEIWQCNADGDYDNDSDAFNQRARLMTDASGTYSFLTILPGKYLNEGRYRPAHIHYRVTAPNSKELISQLYFKGDPHIATDQWASKEKAKMRIVEMRPVDVKGNLALDFDIYLQGK